MMNVIKSLTRVAVKNDSIWHVAKKILRFVEHQRYLIKSERIMNSIEQEPKFSFLLRKEVLHGVFKGMKYPSLKSAGSTLYPKLLGSYESELREVLDRICATNYSEILDIGCAEGYYAVGLAMRLPEAAIYAYDINEKAKKLCKEMSALNKVDNRVTIDGYCSDKTLGDFPFTKKGLVICDCEGYENQLFSAYALKNLGNCDLLIETHDFTDIDISTNIYNVFRPTHDISVIASLDDTLKAKYYDFEELAACSLESKRRILAEGRPATMEWFFMTPKAA